MSDRGQHNKNCAPDGEQHGTTRGGKSAALLSPRRRTPPPQRTADRLCSEGACDEDDVAARTARVVPAVGLRARVRHGDALKLGRQHHKAEDDHAEDPNATGDADGRNVAVAHGGEGNKRKVDGVKEVELLRALDVAVWGEERGVRWIGRANVRWIGGADVRRTCELGPRRCREGKRSGSRHAAFTGRGAQCHRRR